MTSDDDVLTISDSDRKCIYWHREFPPFDAEMIGEHVLEATAVACRAGLPIMTSCGIARITS